MSLQARCGTELRGEGHAHRPRFLLSLNPGSDLDKCAGKLEARGEIER